MGCNAWNHPIDCNCGWGGDTGGGFRATIAVRSELPADGLQWRSATASYDSYVVPNARCPVCGGDVFFYQSPSGGRVFFDELGPPWPKHPCTDNSSWQRSTTAVLGARGYQSAIRSRIPRSEEWHPLVLYRRHRGVQFDRLYVNHQTNGLAGVFLQVPKAAFDGVPIFWRRAPNQPGHIELSAIDSSHKEERQSIPGWFATDADVTNFEAGTPPSARALNMLGWSMSFHWEANGVIPSFDRLATKCGLSSPSNKEWRSHALIDLAGALNYFEQAAALGSWEAKTNLAVILRDGLTEQPQPERAFELFRQAAESSDPIPLRHLAYCYRHAIGTPGDSERASALDDLAKAKEEEISRRIRAELEALMASRTRN